MTERVKMERAEANVLISKLQNLRYHYDGCVSDGVCNACDLSAGKAADTLDDAIAAIRKFICT